MKVWSSTEAIGYIQSQLSKVALSDAEKLAQELDYLPLALAQTIAYTKQVGITLSEYLPLLEEQFLSMLDQQPNKEYIDYPKSVKATLLLSVNKIQEASQDALKLLCLCSWLYAENIPIEFFKQPTLLRNKLCVHDALKILRGYSMVSSSGNFIKIHRIVQKIMQGEQKIDQCVSLFVVITTALHEYYPKDKKTKEDIDTIRMLMPHLEQLCIHLDPEKIQEIIPITVITEDSRNILIDCYLKISSSLSDAQRYLGNHVPRVLLLERILIIQESRYGATSEEVAITLAQLSYAYVLLGTPQRCKSFAERALAIQEKIYDTEHPKYCEIARTLGDLANATADLGDSKTAKTLFEQALAIEEEYYASNDPQLAITLFNLAQAYGEIGDPFKKKELLERALAIEENYYQSKDYYEMGITLFSLANAYGELGNSRKKKELLERAEKMQKLHYGETHNLVAATQISLGNAYGELGNPQKQKQYLEQGLVIRKKYYGEKNFEIAFILRDFAVVYGELGNPIEQKNFAEKALAIQTSHYGKDHYQVAITLTVLSHAEMTLNNLTRSQVLLEHAMLIQKEYYPAQHYQLAKTLYQLACLNGKLHNPLVQKILLQDALVIQETFYGQNNYQIALTLVVLADAYITLNEVETAKELLERALSIQRSHYGCKNYHIAETLIHLAVVAYKLKDYHHAKLLLEQVLFIQESHYGRAHYKVAETLMKLAMVLKKLEDISYRATLNRSKSIWEFLKREGISASSSHPQPFTIHTDNPFSMIHQYLVEKKRSPKGDKGRISDFMMLCQKLLTKESEASMQATIQAHSSDFYFFHKNNLFSKRRYANLCRLLCNFNDTDLNDFFINYFAYIEGILEAPLIENIALVIDIEQLRQSFNESFKEWLSLAHQHKKYFQ